MNDQPRDWSEEDDEDRQAEELLSSIRESKPHREVLLAEKVRHLDVDPNDPAMIFPVAWPKKSLAHTIVRYRSPEGIAMEVIESWAPVEIIPVTTLAERDLHELIEWLVRNRRTNPRRAREQVYVWRSPSAQDGEHLEVFPDDLVIHRGPWVFDGNDSLLLMQRNLLRREALLVYERDLEFEVIFPPAFVATPQMGAAG
jgi:DNA-binding GntR family transcriptional regulator